MKKLFTSIIIGLISSTLVSAESLDLREILKSANVSIDYKALDAGEIIYTSRKELETTDTSIAVGIGLYVKGSYTDVLADFKAQNNQLSSYFEAIVVEIKEFKNIEPYFKRVKFTKSENDEVQRLLIYDDGKEFNFSDAEVSTLKRTTKEKGLSAQQASVFFKNLLKSRTETYLKEGVLGIESYNHADEDTSVKNDLQTSSLHFNVLKNHFPILYKDYLHYPNITSNIYEQKFYWLKDKIEGRLTFTLKHQMIEEKNHFFLILERQFYISNGLDTLQTQILCIPYKEGTFIALSSQSFTPKVSGFGRRISVRVGRHIMSENIRPMFENLQKKYN